MNGPEHFREAERLLADVAKARGAISAAGKGGMAYLPAAEAHAIENALASEIAQATAHATLALALATAEARYTEANLASGDSRTFLTDSEWHPLFAPTPEGEAK